MLVSIFMMHRSERLTSADVSNAWIAGHSATLHRPLRIAVLTAHIFAVSGRKASLHFVADEWARLGHSVHFCSVGLSWLSRWSGRSREMPLPEEQRNRFATMSPGLEAGAYVPPVHAFSMSRRALDPVSTLLFRIYGSRLPAFMARPIANADLIVVEGGTPLAFLPLLRRLNPGARLLYFCRDLLATVGASSYLLSMERSWTPRFDSICVPSRRLGTLLPPGGKVHYVPQAIDRTLFDAEMPSPYEPGTLNIISIGNMLFDYEAVAALARGVPQARLHLFGVKWTGELPANLTIYGERGFRDIVPYIKHADIGLAAYRSDEREDYLAESSLKLLQYGYCGLPALLPENLPVDRGNEIRYRRNADNDWAALVEAAVALKRSKNLKIDAMTWQEVALASLATLPDFTMR